MKPIESLAQTLSSRRQLLLRLYREEVLPRRPRYVLAGLCLVGVAAATSASAWLMRDVINEIFVDGNARMLWSISALVAVIFIAKGLSEYGAKLILGQIGNNITAGLRQRFFAHLLRQELRFFVNANSSQLVARLIRQIDAVRQTAELIISGVIRDLLTLLGLVFVMLRLEPTLFAIGIPSTLVVIWVIGQLGSRLGRVVRAEYQADVKLISSVQETTQGIRSVKAFNLNRRLQQRFDEFIEQSESRANRINGIISLSAPLTETMGGLAIAGVILYGGWSAINTQQPPGEFMAFITALLLAYEPAKRLSHLRLQLEQRLNLVASFYRFMDREPLLAEPKNAIELEHRQPAEIRLHHVGFYYTSSETPVLRDIQLSLSAGEITALCGPTGGGKSTLVDLILRFHDPVSGTITLAGHGLKTLSWDTLNDYFSYVSQDVFLFDASIGENIRLGCEQVDDTQVRAAANAALLDEFISELPDGYATQVGEKGIRLSGGQRQRIAIARALLKQAPVLILDEATSALDPGTERLILKNLRQQLPQSSLLIVSHRLAPLAIADHLVLLDQGSIIEQGSYQSLARPGTQFHQLFATQLQSKQPAPSLERSPTDFRKQPE